MVLKKTDKLSSAGLPIFINNLRPAGTMSKKKDMAIDFQDNMILLTRKYLKRKIMCPETKFRHHVNERLHVLDLVKRTVEIGESNSVLLVGPRGSGKTTV